MMFVLKGASLGNEESTCTDYICTIGNRVLEPVDYDLKKSLRKTQCQITIKQRP